MVEIPLLICTLLGRGDTISLGISTHKKRDFRNSSPHEMFKKFYTYDSVSGVS